MFRILFRLLSDQRGCFSGGGAETPAPGPQEMALAQLIRSQKRKFEPIQAGLLAKAEPLAGDVFRTDLSPQERETMESQFGNAKESILGRTQRGGLQQKMLGNLDIERARTVANSINEMKRLGSLRAFGAVGPALTPGMGLMGGFQNLAGFEQARTQMGMQAAQQQGQGLGGLLGGGLGLLGMLPMLGGAPPIAVPGLDGFY